MERGGKNACTVNLNLVAYQLLLSQFIKVKYGCFTFTSHQHPSLRNAKIFPVKAL